MNVLLTQRCVRSCPYCFAHRHMAESKAEEILPWEDLVYLADFLRASGERHISLLGGEPSLHPAFPDFLAYLRERGFSVTVFTSGIMPAETLRRTRAALAGDAEEGVWFSCNLNDPRRSPGGEAEPLGRFLGEFGPRVRPGFNIYREDFELGFLFELMERHDLRRSLRLGLAHPIQGVDTAVVADEGLGRLALRLLEQLPLLEESKVTANFDCGFPLCAFSDEQLGRLVKSFGGRLTFSCGPAFDVGPDMRVWSCFPLSAMGPRSIYEFDSLRDVTAYFEEEHKKARAESCGIYDRCGSCSHRGGLCAGGCLARAMGRRALTAAPA
ncbi:MAG: radical SAM protein [Elusimicrobia bacterium]|nr:radical SAM protein [Elusimicrobiota bacterium]